MNPERRSSGSQFYIVWGQVYNDAQMKQTERQMQMQQMQDVFNNLAAQHKAEIMQMRRDRDRAGLQALQERLAAEAEQTVKAAPCSLSDEQRTAYTTIGGTPHLDGQYTVFGEIVEGFDVLDKICAVETGQADRPVDDVRIIRARVVRR